MNDANDERVGEIEGGARGVDDDPLDERTVRLEEEAHGNDDDEDDENENVYETRFPFCHFAIQFDAMCVTLTTRAHAASAFAFRAADSFTRYSPSHASGSAGRAALSATRASCRTLVT